MIFSIVKVSTVHNFIMKLDNLIDIKIGLKILIINFIIALFDYIIVSYYAITWQAFNEGWISDFLLILSLPIIPLVVVGSFSLMFGLINQFIVKIFNYKHLIIISTILSILGIYFVV